MKADQVSPAIGDLERGQRALARGDWTEACSAFTRALETRESAEAIEGLGWARYWLDDVRGSLDLRERAIRVYRERGDLREAARVTIAVGLDALDVHGEAVSTGWFELARRLLEGLDPCAELGWLALWEGHLARLLRNDVDDARKLGAEAAAIGRKLRIADLELLGAALEGLIFVSEGRVQKGMRRLDASMAAALIGEMTDLYSVAATCCLLIHACHSVRDYNRLGQWSSRVDAFADHWNINSMFSVCRTQHAAMLIGRGRWADADALLESIAADLLHSRPWYGPEVFEQLGELRRRQGRIEEAKELFRKAGARALPLIGRAQIALDDGAANEALDLCDRALRLVPDSRWTDRASALNIIVRARTALGEIEQASADASTLAEVASTASTEFATGLAAMADGCIALHVGDHDVAVVVLGDAIAKFERSGAPYEAARARIAVAHAMLAAGRGEAAVIEVDGAIQAFEQLGAARELGRATALRDRLTAGDGAERAPGPLSPREREVLSAVAEGLGDKQIAARLGISEHTVHRHVANILTKLGKPSRAAAVAHAVRQRLV